MSDKTSKFIKYNVYDENDNNFSDNDEELEKDYQEELDQEYYYDTIYNIHSSMIEFINNKSLPICEYLDLNSFTSFVDTNFEF
jgi:hypothetical protein